MAQLIGTNGRVDLKMDGDLRAVVKINPAINQDGSGSGILEYKTICVFGSTTPLSPQEYPTCGGNNVKDLTQYDLVLLNTGSLTRRVGHRVGHWVDISG